jgi:hypothetical protein
MNKHVETLQNAKLLVLQGWTHGAYARDASNETIHFSDLNATCFCTVGAIYRANGPFIDNNTTGEYYGLRYLWKAVKLENEPELTHWNDAPGRTLNDILDVYDKAIQIANESESIGFEHN